MRLDRSLIKTQAKQIIKDQLLKLFLISLVVGLLSGGIGTGVSAGVDAVQNFFDEATHNENFIEDFKDEFGQEFGFNNNKQNDKEENKSNDEKPNLDYFKNFDGNATLVSVPNFNFKPVKIQSNFGGLITFFLAPLTITLCGLYVMVIRGNKMKLGGMFSYVFSKTFDENYLKKLLLYLLKNIIIVLMSCLLIIPGIIFYYRYYFAETIMADNPNMKAKEALKLSKEMTDGHKGELFALDLSFIGWALLIPFTLGLILIYVGPYYSTTKALYYENFRIRCIQEAAQPQLKYMTEQERAMLFNQQQAPVEEAVVPEEPKDTFGSGMDTNYYNGNF